MLILNTLAPQGCVLSPLLSPLTPPSTQQSVPPHDSNTIIKFADDTTLLITDNDETAYRVEVRDCQYSNLSLSISKTKVLIVDKGA